MLPYSDLQIIAMLCALETGSAGLFLGGFLPSSTQIVSACFVEVFTQTLYVGF
jgi:hypothetical protein